MTITLSNSNPVEYAGNGSAVAFSYPWKISASTDLLVGFIVNGVYTLQSSGTYTVAGVGNNGGGSITFFIAPPLNTTVDLRTQTPETQTTEFANLAAYLPENSTNTADRTVRQLQDLTRQTYTFGIHGPDQEFTAWPTLPVASVRAGFSLVFDTNGLPALGTAASAGTITGTIIANLLNLITGIAPTADKIRTPAEIAAAVTPANYAYAVLNPFRYGADGAGGANDANALIAVQNVLAQIPTGTKQWTDGLAAAGFPQSKPEATAGLAPLNYSKFPSPWKDISRFVPDNLGTNDYSVQLNAAFSAEKNIIIPEGTYLFGPALGTPITLRAGQTVTGGGRGTPALATTIIKVTSTTVQPFATANGSSGTGGLVLSNFCITGPGSGTSTTVALDFVSCFQASLEKMLIIGFLTGWNLRQGISSNSSFLNSSTDSLIVGNATNIAASLNSNRLTLRNTSFGAGGAASTTGLKVYDSLGLSIYGGDCEGCSLVAVDLDNTVGGVIGNHLISGVDFEANTSSQGDIRIGNTGSVSTVEINASSFSPGGSNPYPINVQRCDGLAIAHSKLLAGYATGIINVGVSLTNLAIISSPTFFAGGSAVAGMVLSTTGAKAVGHSAAPITLVNSNSIVTAGKRAEIFTAAGNITGLALNAGTSPGQQFTMINEVNFTFTMAAAGTSLVSTGVGCVVPALSQKTFYWDAVRSLWVPN